jgi:hypothetical protein
MKYAFSPSWYSVTEEYQDGENSYSEFFGFVLFLQLAIHIQLAVISEAHSIRVKMGFDSKYPLRFIPYVLEN